MACFDALWNTVLELMCMPATEDLAPDVHAL